MVSVEVRDSNPSQCQPHHLRVGYKAEKQYITQ